MNCLRRPRLETKFYPRAHLFRPYDLSSRETAFFVWNLPKAAGDPGVHVRKSLPLQDHGFDLLF